MTSSTSGTSGISGAASAAAAAAAKTGTDASKGKDLGDKDTFLKLLVAQLKYQDPSNPADSTQFLAQTAQFTQVEKLEGILDMLKSQQLIGASALVGRTVTYMDPNGDHQTGVINSAKLNGDSEPTLRIGNTDVQLSKVMEVQTLSQETGPATPPAAAKAAPPLAAQATAAAVAAAQTPPPAAQTATPAKPATGTTGTPTA
jgi:flagellar basal-body rod modification protein FlgD